MEWPCGFTVALSITAWIIKALGRSIFGILRTAPNRFHGFGTLYVELFRNVPLIVHFFTWYLVVPELLPEDLLACGLKAELDPNIQFFLSSMICLGLFTAAVFANRYAPRFPVCLAGRRTRRWRWG